MLAAMSGQHAAAPRWRAWCLQKRKVTRFSWKKSSATSPRKANCSTTPAKWRPGLRADQLQVPEGVRLVLGRRLNRVGTDAKRILTTAAVIGRSFSFRLLEALENASNQTPLWMLFEEAEARPSGFRRTRLGPRNTLPLCARTDPPDARRNSIPSRADSAFTRALLRPSKGVCTQPRSAGIATGAPSLSGWCSRRSRKDYDLAP